MTYHYSQEEKMELLENCIYILSDIYLSNGREISVSRQELSHMFFLSDRLSNIFSLTFRQSSHGFLSEELNNFLDREKFVFDLRYPIEGENDQFWFVLSKSFRKIMKRPKITQHINAISTIIEGFCSPFGLKLLAATLHFSKSISNSKEIEKLEYLINNNFPQQNKFTKHHIEKALLNLEPILSCS